MFIAMPRCTFKCGKQYCQNSETALAPDIEIDEKSIVKRYIDNPITESLVLGEQNFGRKDVPEEIILIGVRLPQYT